jgi:hypothetical protein
MGIDRGWIGAADAARVLRVSRATLYAYVSRGYVRSQALPGSSRERRYSRDDVERLRRRTEERRDPDKAAARVLQWGLPILESSITLIDGHRLYYRGHDAVALSRSRSLEEVASLVWTGRFDAHFPSAPFAVAAPDGRSRDRRGGRVETPSPSLRWTGVERATAWPARRPQGNQVGSGDRPFENSTRRTRRTRRRRTKQGGNDRFRGAARSAAHTVTRAGPAMQAHASKPIGVYQFAVCPRSVFRVSAHLRRYAPQRCPLLRAGDPIRWTLVVLRGNEALPQTAE